MRVFDRDLIRGGHYGQRSCEPHLKAEHMAAPTKPAYVKKALANLEPSTHGTKPTSNCVRYLVAMGWKADIIGSLGAFPLLTQTGHRDDVLEEHIRLGEADLK
jgi:pyrimidine deaminase RibD-like protein